MGLGGQSLLLLQRCRPKIGERSGRDTKTGFKCRAEPLKKTIHPKKGNDLLPVKCYKSLKHFEENRSLKTLKTRDIFSPNKEVPFKINPTCEQLFPSACVISSHITRLGVCDTPQACCPTTQACCHTCPPAPLPER